MHADVGEQHVQERKKQIIADRKLVLVLDLDNTLIHSKEINLRELKCKDSRDPQYLFLIDEVLSIYEIKMINIAFHVKLRPFLAEFFK